MENKSLLGKNGAKAVFADMEREKGKYTEIYNPPKDPTGGCIIGGVLIPYAYHGHGLELHQRWTMIHFGNIL